MYIDLNGSARVGTSDYGIGSLTSTKGSIDISAWQGSTTVAGLKHAQPAQPPSARTRREQLAEAFAVSPVASQFRRTTRFQSFTIVHFWIDQRKWGRLP